jgi:hypothetical protein
MGKEGSQAEANYLSGRQEENRGGAASKVGKVKREGRVA